MLDVAFEEDDEWSRVLLRWVVGGIMLTALVFVRMHRTKPFSRVKMCRFGCGRNKLVAGVRMDSRCGFEVQLCLRELCACSGFGDVHTLSQ